MKEFRIHRVGISSLPLYFDLLRDAIKAGLPKEMATEMAVANCFEAMQMDEQHVWLISKEGEGIYGLLITQLGMQSLVEVGVVNILVAYSLETIPHEVWLWAVETIKKWAKANGAKLLEATTKVEKMQRVLEDAGAKLQPTYRMEI